MLDYYVDTIWQVKVSEQQTILFVCLFAESWLEPEAVAVRVGSDKILCCNGNLQKKKYDNVFKFGVIIRVSDCDFISTSFLFASTGGYPHM